MSALVLTTSNKVYETFQTMKDEVFYIQSLLSLHVSLKQLDEPLLFIQ